MRKLAILVTVVFITTGASAQWGLTLPPSGGNQKASVTQFIGPVKVTVDYSSPDVHAPDGSDRRGKIFGTDVAHYGLRNQNFGTCTACPWRAGANENTTFTVSHDVVVEGQPLAAGTYGLFMIGGPDEWTVVFSKDSKAWGSYFYDPASDALRVKVKPSKAEYNEWLTYEFTDRKADRATVALKWEDLQVPFTVSVPKISDIYMAALRGEMNNDLGFGWQNRVAAARYALENKHLDDALAWAKIAAENGFTGQENFTTLALLADVLEAKGLPDAKTTREKAFAAAGPIELHTYARQQLQRGNQAEAVRAWELNAKKHADTWPVNVGLMRARSAQGNFKEALRYARLALAQAPDPVNRQGLEAAIKSLEEGKALNP